MDIFKQGMKAPARPAPAVPSFSVNRYSPVTNWNDDPFGADVFEPNPHDTQKKKPPPRPPPPKVNKQPDIPNKPSHFIRRPTVLTSLLSRNKNKNVATNLNANVITSQTDFNSDFDSHKLFSKCETKAIQTGALIDLSSPPSSPTFTTRSSSDGLSVDSFGSDATSSTNHHNAYNGGSTSQAESGFEDDFDMFLHPRKPTSRDDTFDDFTSVDPFSPQPVNNKPPIMKKPVLSNDLFDVMSSGKGSNSAALLKGPTIIRAKPARPKPPDNTALLKSTFGNSIPVTLMNVNTTTPIQKVSGFGESFEDTKLPSWDRECSLDREPSPPMPSVPPPPPPVLQDDLQSVWPAESREEPLYDFRNQNEPHAIALFNYSTGHPDDLAFVANTRIKLIRRENEEWLFGSLPNGTQGLFPANYVEIKVPLPNEQPSSPALGTAVALYDLHSDQPGDLSFATGDAITVTHKINDDWYYGQCHGMFGQFPVNYVQMNS